jgi:hypothetical protein
LEEKMIVWVGDWVRRERQDEVMMYRRAGEAVNLRWACFSIF